MLTLRRALLNLVFIQTFNWRAALRNACIEEHLHRPIKVVEEEADNGDDDKS